MANIKTATEELAEVQEALRSVTLGGQSYQIGSRRLTRADYSKLLNRQKELQAELAASGDTSLIDGTYVSIFEGR